MKIEIKSASLNKVILSMEGKNLQEVLEKAAFDKFNLYSAYLPKAILKRAKLKEIMLKEANLQGADLRDADLSYADLHGADLRGAYLNGTNLIGANLSGANLNRANLSRAILDFTNIPMHCETLKGVKIDIHNVRQMLLHVYALNCNHPDFKEIKKSIEEHVIKSERWKYYKAIVDYNRRKNDIC